jgi:hypothetical protein
MTVNQDPYFATLYSCTSPWHLILDAFTHAQLSVISGESPAFYPTFTLNPISTTALTLDTPVDHQWVQKILFKRAQHLAPSGVLLSRGQDVAFV